MPLQLAIENRPLDQIYIHENKDTGEVRVFQTGAMARFAQEYAALKPDGLKCCTIDLKPGHMEHIRKNSGVEQARLDRLVGSPWRYNPLVCAYFDDGTTTIVDGSHRALRLYDDGERTTKAFIFWPVLWEQFLLPIPEKPEVKEKFRLYANGELGESNIIEVGAP